MMKKRDKEKGKRDRMAMLPLMVIPLLQMAQVEESMDVAQQSRGGAPVAQRPLSVSNPNYISLLKQDVPIGQKGHNHCGSNGRFILFLFQHLEAPGTNGPVQQTSPLLLK
uniref:Uncharacterized protein n=1 Tax=Romanomermis culicivorax TaxID=13658 RepID=A0A915KXV0_ROMCU